MRPYKRLDKSTTIALFAAGMMSASLFGVQVYAESAPHGALIHASKTFHKNSTIHGVFGKVATINGTTLGVVSINPKDNSTMTFAVDGASTTISKRVEKSKPIPATLSDIVVGDTVMIQGVVTGTSVKATSITLGLPVSTVPSKKYKEAFVSKRWYKGVKPHIEQKSASGTSTQ